LALVIIILDKKPHFGYKIEMKETLLFLREFARRPSQIGAIAPSSPQLTAEIVRQAGVHKAGIIVEFGPGTGSFTREILRQKKDNAFFVGIETNTALVKTLRKKFPKAIIVANSAEHTLAILKKHHLSEADCIVSGLPWAMFPSLLQDKLLEAAVDSLRPGGRFTTFAYLHGLLLPTGLRFRQKLKENFSKVHLGRIIWKNIPPAFVYRCIK
jgi:phosphatidylethanolamine/phosphatidyl-N-methylethanolamine N-methyltransferase